MGRREEGWKNGNCARPLWPISECKRLLTRSRCLESRLIHRADYSAFIPPSLSSALLISSPRDRSLNRLLDAIFIVHYSATESRRDNIKAVIFRIRLLFPLYRSTYTHTYIYIHTRVRVFVWSGNEATASSPPGTRGLSVAVGGKRFERSEPPPFLISY